MSLNFKDSNFYLIFILTFLLTNVFSDSSTTRYGAVSVVVDNKIYIVGGCNIELHTVITSVIYVDLTRDFDATNVPWVNDKSMPIGIGWGVGAVGGSNKSTIFLFGGAMVNPISKKFDFSNLLYAFDVYTKVWSVPKTTGTPPTNRRESSVVVDDKGIIYMLGGAASEVTGSATRSFFNDIYTLNTVDLTWNKVIANNAPLPFIDHTSTLLSDGKIAIIGGREGVDLNLASIFKIKIFDINSLTWSIMTASGPTSIQPRGGHSAVLSNDGRIIVYGGTNSIGATSFPEIIVLDTTTNPFQWSIPNFSLVDRASPLTFHTANLIGDQMIISFGNITNNFTDPQLSTAKTYILDIKDYSGIIVVAIASFIIVRLYKKKKKSVPSDVVEIPSQQQLQQYRNSHSNTL